ncbi:MAG TPA: glutamate racemase [Fredinandcohnia sp.]|nr:glutamate racemase [Fredinandcohnia sp.]
MIGVFDSGVGGLTILRAIRERLPGVPTIYLGDTARVPYGTKSPEVVVRYSRNNAALLLREGVEMLVVACNTASAHALDVLRAELPIPVFGVVEPGVEAAIAARPGGRIGVIGTEGTIASGAYQRAIEARTGRPPEVARACPLFVPLAEEGWTEGPVAEAVAERYLGDLRGRVDVLILGCTHYPLLRPALARVLGEEVALVDAGAAVADILAARAPTPAGADAAHRLLVTDVPARFFEVAQRFLGSLPGAVEQVDL